VRDGKRLLQRSMPVGSTVLFPLPVHDDQLCINRSHDDDDRRDINNSRDYDRRRNDHRHDDHRGINNSRD